MAGKTVCLCMISMVIKQPISLEVNKQWYIYTSSWHIYCKQPGEYTPSNEGKAYTCLQYHNQPMTCIQPVTIDLYEC